MYLQYNQAKQQFKNLKNFIKDNHDMRQGMSLLLTKKQLNARMEISKRSQ